MGVLGVRAQEQVQVAVLNTGVQVGLTEEIFKWNGGGEDVSCVDIRENNSLDRGNSQCQGLRWDYGWYWEQKNGQCGPSWSGK